MVFSSSPLEIAFLIPFPDSISFIVLFLAFGQTEDDFDLAVLEIHLQRDERIPLLVDFAIEPFDLSLMEEKFAWTQGVVIAIIGILVRADVKLVDPDFTVGDFGIAVFEIGPPAAQRLDFGTDKHDTGFESVLDEIIKPCFAVFSYLFYVVWIGHGGSDFSSPNGSDAPTISI